MDSRLRTSGMTEGVLLSGMTEGGLCVWKRGMLMTCWMGTMRHENHEANGFFQANGHKFLANGHVK